MMRPTNKVLLLHKPKRQHLPITAHAPERLERFLAPCPISHIITEEEMVGEDGDVVAGEDVGVDVVSHVTNVVAFVRAVEQVEVDLNRTEVVCAIEGLWVGGLVAGRDRIQC